MSKRPTFTQQLYKNLAFWCSILLGAAVLGGLVIIPIFWYYGRNLPDYHQLTMYDPPTISRVYSSEGYLMSELAAERRIFTRISEIPQIVIHAFIAAEDQNYYNHPGVDVMSIIRAAFQNLAHIGSDRNPIGGSTITQQVVKNFLLTNERSISRKVKEAILAYRINNVYSKDRILELYLNQIYLGNGAYGVASAALSYFNKDLKHITLEEAALLAALPKAPSLLDPAKHGDKVQPRRDWVLERMYDEDFISKEQMLAAKAIPINLTPRFEDGILDSGYYTESVRLELIERYGYDHVYQQGLSVYANLNKRLQIFADEALRKGLLEYDRRHGYTGPMQNIKVTPDSWQKELSAIDVPEGGGKWRLGVVLSATASSASVGLRDGSKVELGLDAVKWARKRLPSGYVGKEVTAVSNVLSVGDVIWVGHSGKATLEQIPEVNGAIVVMQPKTGKVLAMSGGYSFKQSKYNRAIQALRQPGSAFKPFVYLTALEKGFTPTSTIFDEPISIPQGPGLPNWTPKNFEGDFMGEITLRKGLEKSRNLATVYVIRQVGADDVGKTATRLGVYDKAPPGYYSMALGAAETTLMRLTAAFATFASGGMLVVPHIIDRVQDRSGEVIYTSETRKCVGCGGMGGTDVADNPVLQVDAKSVIDPLINYQMISMLQGVVERGTAVRARKLGKVLAGKTGTSNDSNDTWFVGFSPDLVVGVFVGYDTPKSLGAKEQGASVALPIFISFMEKALQNMPNKEFPVPDGIYFEDVDYIGAGGKAGTLREPIRPGTNLAPEPMDDGMPMTESITTEEVQNIPLVQE